MIRVLGKGLEKHIEKKKKNEKHIAIDIYKDELLLYYIFIMKYSK